MLYMNDASYYIPDTYLDVEQAGEILGLSKEHIKVYRKIYGIEKIPAAHGMPFVEFITQPVEKLLATNNINKTDIKYLIHCHTAKVINPFGYSIVRKIKQHLQLESAVALGTSVNNCASTIASLDLLAHVLPNDKKSKAIVVCGDYAFTPVLQCIPNTSILGDASAAILLGRQGSVNKLISISTKIEGKYAKGIWMSPEDANEFEMNYAKTLSATILDAIQKANLTKEQIKIIIPHNVNIHSWKRVANLLEIAAEKIYLKNVRKYSHCFGADIFINYVSAKDEQIFVSGDYYVMATVGLGAVFAAAVFQY